MMDISKIFVREIGKFWKADTLYTLIRETLIFSILSRTYKNVQILISTESSHLTFRFHFAKFLEKL